MEHNTDLSILMVEDSPIMQAVNAEMLSGLGYRVDIAGDGKEALDFYESRQYAAILTDIHMPNMDGIALTQEIRRREINCKPIPVIALTTDFNENRNKEYLAAGINEVAMKPIDSEALRIILNRYLGKL